MTEKAKQASLVRVNELEIGEDVRFCVWPPKQFLLDNQVTKGDKIGIYRNPNTPNELIIRVEKG